jgi:hypothetical protein
MNNNHISVSVIGGIVWALGLSAGLSKDVFELESRYNGDGWFEYSFRTLYDPFLQEIDVHQLAPEFTNFVASVPPVHWTNFFYKGTWDGIMPDRSTPQPRINETTFFVRSSSTSFRRESHGLTAIVYLRFIGVDLDSAGGYITLDCLVPCAPEEADGSLPDLVSRLELVPDLKIEQLIVTNDNIYGVTFSWSYPSTVELQGSHDLTNWSAVARFFGDPPQTTWTTNVALNSFGEFFRLLLVAGRHVTNATASATLSSRSQYSSEIPIASAEMVNGQIRVGFGSVPNAVYELRSCELSGRTTSVRQLQATNAFTRVLLPIGQPRSAVVFKARRLVK